MEQLDWNRQDGKVTEADVDSGLDDELKAIGLFKGMSSDCVKAARKKHKGDDDSFKHWLMLGCIQVKSGTHSIAMEDWAITFKAK